MSEAIGHNVTIYKLLRILACEVSVLQTYVRQIVRSLKLIGYTQ